MLRNVVASGAPADANTDDDTAAEMWKTIVDSTALFFDARLSDLEKRMGRERPPVCLALVRLVLAPSRPNDDPACAADGGKVRLRPDRPSNHHHNSRTRL